MPAWARGGGADRRVWRLELDDGALAGGERLRGGAGAAPFVAGSPNFSLADQFDEPWPGCVSVSGAGRARDLEWYRAAGVALFAWSSLAGGFFSGKVDAADAKTGGEEWRARCLRVYGHERNWGRQERARELGVAKGLSLAQVALAYVLSQECAVFPLVGCQSGAEFAACVRVLEVRLTGRSDGGWRRGSRSYSKRIFFWAGGP